VWGIEVWTHAFLTSALDRGEWSVSRPGHFSPVERASGTHWIGGWAGPRTGLYAVVVGGGGGLCRKSTPGPAAHSISYLKTLFWIRFSSIVQHFRSIYFCILHLWFLFKSRPTSIFTYFLVSDCNSWHWARETYLSGFSPLIILCYCPHFSLVGTLR